MLSEARKRVEEILKAAKNPVVLFSFGKDSTLLVALAREIDPDIKLVHFGQDRHLEIERLSDAGLSWTSYPSSARYFIPWDDSEICLIDEYLIEGKPFPFLRMVELGDPCDIESLPPLSADVIPWPFDVTLCGYKNQDETHPSVPLRFGPDFTMESTRVISPLYEWADAQVLGAIRDMYIAFPFLPDTLRMCSGCLAALNGWDRSAALTTFCRRFGYG
jgi:hypothetical protein